MNTQRSLFTYYFLLLSPFFFANVQAQTLPSGSTGSGLHYQFLKKGTGVQLDSGMIALVFLQQTVTDSTDTLFVSPPPLVPQPASIVGAIDPIMEGFRMMSVGDSAVLKCSASDLFTTPPRGLTATSVLTYNVGIFKAFDNMDAYADYLESLEVERLAKEEEVILAYLQEKGLKGTKTASGLYYVMLEEGKGTAPLRGDKISVHYTGTLLDGTKFDSSHDRQQPFEFNVGTGRVIKGWDEGFMLFKEGGKGLLLIPSNLAYGNKNMGKIKPNSILCFEIELLKNLER